LNWERVLLGAVVIFTQRMTRLLLPLPLEEFPFTLGREKVKKSTIGVLSELYNLFQIPKEVSKIATAAAATTTTTTGLIFFFSKHDFG
jgi:hypothetical protein